MTKWELVFRDVTTLDAYCIRKILQMDGDPDWFEFIDYAFWPDWDQFSQEQKALVKRAWKRIKKIS